jgi:hypothetical protein
MMDIRIDDNGKCYGVAKTTYSFHTPLKPYSIIYYEYSFHTPSKPYSIIYYGEERVWKDNKGKTYPFPQSFHLSINYYIHQEDCGWCDEHNQRQFIALSNYDIKIWY